MIRTAVLLAALALPGIALACGGEPCGDNCAMKSDVEHVEVDVSAAEGTKASFDITGMKCGKCAAKIQTALTALDGVNAANVDADAGKAQIAFDAEKTNVEALLAAIGELGHYEASVSAAATN